MLGVYRKKPVVVQAMQLTDDDSIREAMEWADAQVPPPDYRGEGVIAISTLEGVMIGQVGDYIIKGVKGEFYPCKADIFEATYEPFMQPSVIDQADAVRDAGGVVLTVDD